MAEVFTPIQVTIQGQAYKLTLPYWTFSQADATALKLPARLITAEEAADKPEVLEHLLKIKFGGLKLIANT